MFTEEFSKTLASYRNLKIAIDLCDISYSDPMSIHWELVEQCPHITFRVSKVDAVRVFYFISDNQAAVVFNTAEGLKSMASYINNPVFSIEKLVVCVKEVLKSYDLKRVYFIGHNAAGIYACLVGDWVASSKIITIGSLPLPTNIKLDRLNSTNCVQFIKDDDLLAATHSKEDSVYYLKTDSTVSSVLEGVANNLIESYQTYVRVNHKLKRSSYITSVVRELATA